MIIITVRERTKSAASFLVSIFYLTIHQGNNGQRGESKALKGWVINVCQHDQGHTYKKVYYDPHYFLISAIAPITAIIARIAKKP